jgi:putative oxidoreductase
MSPNPTAWAAPLGRLLLSSIFILSAVGKLNDWQGTAEMMAARGLPAVDALLSIAVGLELVGGVLVLLGLYARWGALTLLIFIVPVTLIMHNFWAQPDAQRMAELVNFMKNVAITGGLLFVLAMGAGPYSVDALWQRKPPPTITVNV